MLVRAALHRQVVRVYSSAQELDISGRAGAVRIRTGTLDVLLMVLYFPPRGTYSSEERRRCAKAMLAWAGGVLSPLGRRTVPIGGMDTKDQFAIHRLLTGEWQHYSGATVGGEGAGREYEIAEEIREFCAAHYLQVETTRWATGSTYFGPRGHGSKVDHFLLPTDVANRVKKVWVDMRAGRRLQVIPAREPRDHMPVRIAVDLSYGRTEKAERKSNIARDLLMRALARGERRREYLEALEKKVQEIGDEVWQEAMDDWTTDGMWELLAKAMREPTTEVFEKHAGFGGQYCEQVKERTRLLRRRAELRNSLDHVDEEEEVDMVKLQLVLASRGCRRERDRQRRERREKLVEEMHEAWKGRRLAEVHRLHSAVASNGRGPKKRFFWAQAIQQPAAEDGSSYL